MPVERDLQLAVPPSKDVSRSHKLRISFPREFLLKMFDLFIGAVLKVDELVAGLPRAVNEFIELQLDGFAITVLTVLNEEDGKKRYQRRSSVYDELPGVGIMKNRSGRRPYNHRQCRHDES